MVSLGHVARTAHLPTPPCIHPAAALAGTPVQCLTSQSMPRGPGHSRYVRLSRGVLLCSQGATVLARVRGAVTRKRQRESVLGSRATVTLPSIKPGGSRIRLVNPVALPFTGPWHVSLHACPPLILHTALLDEPNPQPPPHPTARAQGPAPAHPTPTPCAPYSTQVVTAAAQLRSLSAIQERLLQAAGETHGSAPGAGPARQRADALLCVSGSHPVRSLPLVARCGGHVVVTGQHGTSR